MKKLGVTITVPLRVKSCEPLQMLIKPSADKVVSAMIARDGFWELYNTVLLQTLLCEGDCFVDLGAHLGYFSLIAADCVAETGQVVAFEPEPENYYLCSENIRINQFNNIISLHRLGIGDQEETQQLFRAQHNHGGHQLTYPYRDSFDQEGLPVTVTTLDRFAMTTSALERVDVIKMDVQGYETKALLGMRELIARNRDWLIVLAEYSPTLLRSFDIENKGLERFFQFLKEEVEAVFLIDRQQPNPSDVYLVPIEITDLRTLAPKLTLMTQTQDMDMCVDLVFLFSKAGVEAFMKKLVQVGENN